MDPDAQGQHGLLCLVPRAQPGSLRVVTPDLAICHGKCMIAQAPLNLDLGQCMQALMAVTLCSLRLSSCCTELEDHFRLIAVKLEDPVQLCTPRRPA